MAIGKEALGLTKGDFSKKLSRIVDVHRVNSKVIGKPKDFVLTACRLTGKFAEVANRPDVELRVLNWEAGKRQVKMLVMSQGGKRYPVPKGQLVDQLYPARKTVKHAPPEKKHAQAVRAAMRNAIGGQIQSYRKTLKYPLTCAKSEREIRLGMRVDIDHINKPFVQLCDEFMEDNGLTYCEIKLCGPPSRKRFADNQLMGQWFTYHDINARLAPCLARANRSAGSGEYEAKESLIGTFEGDAGDDVALDW